MKRHKVHNLIFHFAKDLKSFTQMKRTGWLVRIYGSPFTNDQGEETLPGYFEGSSNWQDVGLWILKSRFKSLSLSKGKKMKKVNLLKENIHNWLVRRIMISYCPKCGRYAGCGCTHCSADTEPMRKPYYLRQIWDMNNDHIECPYCGYKTIIDELEDFDCRNYWRPIRTFFRRYWLLSKTYLQGVRYESKKG